MLKTIAFVITVGVAGVIGFVIWKQRTAKKLGGIDVAALTLPGWDDVRLRGSVPKDIEWTCHREQPDEPDECKGERDVPIKHLRVSRRPDMGVIGFGAEDVDAATVELLRKRWGKPTKTRNSKERFAMAWCSDDQKTMAMVDGSSARGTATIAIATWPILPSDACKRMGADKDTVDQDHPGGAEQTHGRSIEGIPGTTMSKSSDECRFVDGARTRPCTEDERDRWTALTQAIPSAQALLDDGTLCVATTQSAQLRLCSRDEREHMAEHRNVVPANDESDERGVRVSPFCQANPLAKGCS